jgi:glycosyltransferase involved in cell wall biosynthesis
MKKSVKISVVIPVLARTDDLEELYAGYERALESLEAEYETIFVVDGGGDRAFDELKPIAAANERVSIIRLAKFFGESMALSAGFDRAQGELILTLPAYFQVEPESIAAMFDALSECDLVIGRRWPRAGGTFETIRRKTFHFLLKLLSGESYNDLGCGVRLFRRQVARDIQLYGDQHRFFPVLANRQGFKVREIDVRQSPRDDFKGHYRLREYLHRLLDIITVFFLVRFTKKPLRFFGMVGSIASALGALVVLTLVVQRLFFEMALADRPALLLGSLLLVLGVQIFALGLIGELIIFTHAGHMKEYAVAEIVSQKNLSPDPAATD